MKHNTIASLDPDTFLNRTEDEPLLQHYAMLHDGLSDMIEGGRLTEEMIPDDYQWLVRMLINADAIHEKEQETNDEREDPTGHQSYCHAVKVLGAECDCEGFGEYIAAKDNLPPATEAELTDTGDDWDAILPDGTRTEWDERLRTVGARRVPKL